jgi:hypothetical protein
MAQHVSVLTVEDLEGLTLLRTPKYESLLLQEERGVSVSTAFDGASERELLVALRWGARYVLIESTRRRFNLDIRALETDEIAKAKSVLRESSRSTDQTSEPQGACGVSRDCGKPAGIEARAGGQRSRCRCPTPRSGWCCRAGLALARSQPSRSMP